MQKPSNGLTVLDSFVRDDVFTRVSAEKDLSDVAFIAGEKQSRLKIFQTLENAILSETESLDKIFRNREQRNQ